MAELRGCVWVMSNGERCARADTTRAEFWTDAEGVRQEHHTEFCAQHFDVGVAGLLRVVPGLEHRPRWMDIFENERR